MSERPGNPEFPSRRPETGGPSKETKETGLTRHEVEFVDADGERIGTAVYELETDDEEMMFNARGTKEHGRGRRLRSLVIKGERDGEPHEVDLLALADPHGIDVIVADAYLDNYNYQDDKRKALSPPLNTPVDVGVLLHELGHADQYRDPRIKGLTPFYGSERTFAPAAPHADDRLALMKRTISGAVETVPNLEQFVDHEAIGQLENLDRRRQGAMDEVRRTDGEVNKLDREQETARREFVTGIIERKLDLKKFLARCVELDEDLQDKGDDPRLRRKYVDELLDSIEEAGLRTSIDDAEPAEIGIRPPEADRLPLVPESKITEIGDVSDLVTSITKRMSTLTSTIEHRDGILRVNAEILGEKFRGYRIELAVPVGKKAYEDHEAKMDALESQVQDLLHEGDGLRRTAMDAERAFEMVYEGSTLPAVVGVPTKIMERDATRRAFRWLRKVRDLTGADLLKPHAVTRGSMLAGRCADATERGADDPRTAEEDAVTTVYEDLKRGLESYGAGKSWKLHRPDDGDEGGMRPSVGRQRGPGQ